jgi:hypothetical protein
MDVFKRHDTSQLILRVYTSSKQYTEEYLSETAVTTEIWRNNISIKRDRHMESDLIRLDRDSVL